MQQKEHLYYTYIVASRTHVLYIGVTSTIELRIWQHNNGAYEGFSKQFNCNRLVWFERFGQIEAAIAREKQIKRWSRVKKITLIERINPTWIDLSENWGKPVASFDFEAHEAKSKATAGPSTTLLRNFARDDKD